LLAATFLLPAFLANGQHNCNAPGSSIRRNACLPAFQHTPVINTDISYQTLPFVFDGMLEGTEETHPRADTIYTYSTTNGNRRESFTYDALQQCLTELVQKWQGTQWENMFQTTYTYDANGNCLTEVLKEWQNNAWVNNKMTTNAYDPNGNNLTSKEQEWLISAWVNVALTTQSFDGSGNVISTIYSEWVNNAWENQSKTTYTYNAGGDPVQVLYQKWQANDWENYFLMSITYDGSGNIVAEVLKSWQSNSWINYIMMSMTYDGSGNMLTQLQQMWQTNVWEYKYLITFTYDANGNCLTEILKEWQGGGWVNNAHITNTYDSNSNLLNRVEEEYINNAWVNSTKLEYLYQPEKITANSYEWNGVMWSPYDAIINVTYMGYDLGGGQNAYSVEVIYSEFLGVEEHAAASISAMTLYPNPAAGLVSLRINTSLQGNCTLTLFDLSGRIIRVLFEGKSDQVENLTFDAGGLPPGMYLLELKSAGLIDRQKLSVIQ